MISKKNRHNLEKTQKFFKEYPLVLIYQHNNLTVKQRIDLKVQFQALNNVKTLTVKNSLVDRACFLQNKSSSSPLTPGRYSLKEPVKSPLFQEWNKIESLGNSLSSSSIQTRHDLQNRNNSGYIHKINAIPIGVQIPKVKELIGNPVADPYAKDKQFETLLQNQLQNLIQGPIFLVGCHDLEDLKKIWDNLKPLPGFLFLGCQFNNQIYTHLDVQKTIELNNRVYYEFLNILNQKLTFQYNTVYYNIFSIIQMNYLRLKTRDNN